MAVVEAVAVEVLAAKRWGVMGGGRRGSEPPCHAEGAARVVEEGARLAARPAAPPAPPARRSVWPVGPGRGF